MQHFCFTLALVTNSHCRLLFGALSLSPHSLWRYQRISGRRVCVCVCVCAYVYVWVHKCKLSLAGKVLCNLWRAMCVRSHVITSYTHTNWRTQAHALSYFLSHSLFFYETLCVQGWAFIYNCLAAFCMTKS